MTEPTDKPKRRRSKNVLVLFLGVTLLAAGLSSVGTAAYLFTTYDKRAEKSDHAVKSLFYEFCVKRAIKWQADEEARAVCKNIWDGALAASADSGQFVSPFLLAKIVQHESKFDCSAVGRNRGNDIDWGCAQINLKSHGRTPYGCDVIEPRCNIYTGAMIYAGALRAFGGNEQDALYGYNRGISSVRLAKSRGENPSNGYAGKVI